MSPGEYRAADSHGHSRSRATGVLTTFAWVQVPNRSARELEQAAERGELEILFLTRCSR
jgi:hypothetical protein